MTITHLTRYKLPYCDAPGNEYAGYCGQRTDYTMYPPAFSSNMDQVDCEKCLTTYAMEELAKVP